MSTNELPEGFKRLSQGRDYGLSEKGEIFDVKNGRVLVAPEGESVITIREESPGRAYSATFDIPKLLAKHFGEQKGLSQKDFDELVAISGLSVAVCRELLDKGWAFETTTDQPNIWVQN